MTSSTAELMSQIVTSTGMLINDSWGILYLVLGLFFVSIVITLIFKGINNIWRI